MAVCLLWGGADVRLISIDFAKAKIRKLYLLYVVTMLAMVPMVLAQGWLHGKSLLMNLGTIVAKLAICAPLVQSAFGTTHLSHAFNGVCWFFSTLALIYLVSPWLMKRIAGWHHVWRAVAVLPVVIAVLYVVFGMADAQVSFFDDFAYGSSSMAWFWRASSLHGGRTARYRNGCHRQRSVLQSPASFGSSCGIRLWRWERPARSCDSWMSCSVGACSSSCHSSGDVSLACWSGRDSCALAIWRCTST